MSEPRLILIPQLQVHMRYQHWWPAEIERHMAPYFPGGIIRLEMLSPGKIPEDGSFSHPYYAVGEETQQIKDYMNLQGQDNDVLFHCDLSYPGIFHSVLAHKRPKRAVVFCHATALNSQDVFAPIRRAKWPIECGHARLYDKVLVATQYHAQKLTRGDCNENILWNNVHVMGALPYPPANLWKQWRIPQDNRDMFCSVARNHPQKVDVEVESEIHKQSGYLVIQPRGRLATWYDYYDFLSHRRYMIITAKEETFGYQVMDAILAGCVPIAPNAYSYPELIEPHLLYDAQGTPEQVARRILDIVDSKPVCPALKCAKEADGFWTKLAEELLG